VFHPDAEKYFPCSGLKNEQSPGIKILGAMYARRSMFEKRDNFFQLISTLFCEVKRGFVDH
jgi:hypothetical protein